MRLRKNRFEYELEDLTACELHKAEIFSIGLTLLEVCTLIESSKLFERRKFQE